MTTAIASEKSGKVAALTPHNVPDEVRLRRLAQLDFTHIKRKLMQPEPEGKGWTPEMAEEGERWYRRFLELFIRHPEQKHVPDVLIDEFWHQHILDTKAYGSDCEHVLGYFLHHDPYYGMNGDVGARDDSFEQTNALYRQYFGEDRITAMGCKGGCSGTRCRNCGGSH